MQRYQQSAERARKRFISKHKARIDASMALTREFLDMTRQLLGLKQNSLDPAQLVSDRLRYIMAHCEAVKLNDLKDLEPIYHLGCSLLAFFMKKKPQNEPLEMERGMYDCYASLIDYQYNLILSLYEKHFKDNTILKRLIRNIEKISETLTYVHNYCLIIEFEINEKELIVQGKEAVQQTNMITTYHISRGWYHPTLLRHQIDMCISIKAYDDAEMALKNLDQIISDKKENDYGKFDYHYNLFRFYYYHSEIALANNNLSDAKKFFLKSRTEAIRLYDLGYPFENHLFLSCLTLLDQMKNDNKKSLFFYDILKYFAQQNAELSLHPERQHKHAAMQKPEIYATSVKAIIDRIHDVKEIIICDLIALLNHHYNSLSIKFTFANIENKFVMRVELAQGRTDELKKMFNNRKIYSECNEKYVYIYKPYRYDSAQLKQAIDEYLKNACENDIIISNDSITMPEAISETTVLIDASVEDVKKNIPKSAKKRNKKKKSAVALNQANDQVRLNEAQIRWGSLYSHPSTQSDNKVYPIYLPYGQANQFYYVCVDSNLANEIGPDHQQALSDLFSLCDRGLVLGNSRGRKGLIIKTAPFDRRQEEKSESKGKSTLNYAEAPAGQTLFIKGKNCKHDWRFFGNTIAAVVDNDGNNHTLLQFNSWRAKHK